MITIKVMFSDGDNLVTRFNGTIEKAKRYYIGNVFNTGVYADHLVKAVSVEIVE